MNRCRNCRRPIDPTRDYRTGRVWNCRDCVERGQAKAMRESLNEAKGHEGRVVRKKLGGI